MNEGGCACGAVRYDPAAMPPDVHIFTRSKLPWMALPDGVPAFDAVYPSSEGVWSDEARARREVMLAG